MNKPANFEMSSQQNLNQPIHFPKITKHFALGKIQQLSDNVNKNQTFIAFSRILFAINANQIIVLICFLNITF